MRSPSLDTWTTIFLLASFQGIFLAIVLFFYPKGNSLANKILASIVAMFSFTMLEYVAYWSRYLLYFPQLMEFSTSFIFLYGVLFWYYVRLLKGKKIIFRDLFHLIPFLCCFFSLIPIYSKNTTDKIAILQVVFSYQNSDNSPNYSWLTFQSWEFWLIWIKISHLILYASLIYREIYQDANHKNLDEANFTSTWLQKVFFAYMGYVLSFLSFYILVMTVGMSIFYDYSISFAMSFFIYWIGYQGYIQPEVFSGFVNKQAQFNKQKYEKPALKEEQAPLYLTKLLILMENEKPYLDNNLKLRDLANRLGLSSHQFSQLVNQHLNQSFTDFINSYRIQEAKELLLAKENQSAKMIGIAYDVGFNNKTSFINAFKKFTGMLPTEFRHQEKSRI